MKRKGGIQMDMLVKPRTYLKSDYNAETRACFAESEVKYQNQEVHDRKETLDEYFARVLKESD